MSNDRQLLRADKGGQLWELSIMDGGRIVGRKFYVTSQRFEEAAYDDQPSAERAMDAELLRLGLAS